MHKTLMLGIYKYFCMIAISMLISVASSFADYNLLPVEYVNESNCAITSPYKCGNYDLIPSNATSIDVDEMDFYLFNKIYMARQGVANTEGMYVVCNNGSSDFSNCITAGESAFTITSDYNSATPNQNKEAVPNSGGSFSGGPYYCPLTRCDVTTNDIQFYIIGNNGNININIESGHSVAVPIDDVYSSMDNISPDANYIFNVRQVGNNMCLFVTSDMGQLLLGCKGYGVSQNPNPNPNPSPSPTPSNSSCFSNTACMASSLGHSKVFWSVSSKIVECVRDVVDIVFMTNNPQCAGLSFFTGLQDGLRQVVFVALILYVILTGIKIVTSGGEFSKGEFFLFILKFSLVLYFSVGIVGSDGKFHSGLTEYVYPFGLSAMTSFSNFIMTAASSDGLCYYDPSSYASGYSYLAIWDSLDCHVAYYLGLYSVNTSGSVESVILGVFGVIIPAFFSLEIIFFILIIIYGIFILSFMVYFVHFYIVAIIMFAITVYIGVITVPLALFQYTKGFYDSWMKVIVSYVIQPVIVVAFMAFMLMIFDLVVFGNCQFTTSTAGNVNYNIFAAGNTNYNIWTTDGTSCTNPKDPRCCQSGASNCMVTQCENTLGYQFLYNLNDGFLGNESAIFFDYAIINIGAAKLIPALTEALLKVLLFLYLLSLFGQDLAEFAAHLTSGPNIGKFAKNPMETFKDIIKSLTDSSKSDSSKGGNNSKSGDGVSAATKKREGIDVMKK